MALFSFFRKDKQDEINEPPQSESPPQSTKPAYKNLQPPSGVKLEHSNPLPQQGLGIGRQSKTPVLSSGDLSDKEKSQFFTDCKKEYLNSINCRLEHHDHKESNVCQPLFDVYKDCRKLEHERRLEANAKRGTW